MGSELARIALTCWLPWRVLHSTRGYYGSPGTVGSGWVLLQGTVGTAQYPWVLQGTVGTVGTARVKVTVRFFTVRAGTAGYCGYCRVLGTVGTTRVCCRVLQGTAGCTES
jgi:hypothetical protein